jgi:hypothetical protein
LHIFPQCFCCSFSQSTEALLLKYGVLIEEVSNRIGRGEENPIAGRELRVEGYWSGSDE